MAPEVGTQVGIQGRDARIPADLIAYIQAGNPVRTEQTDPSPGRCGADKNRSGGRTAYCDRAAGFGTKHQGIARCKQHDKGDAKYSTGLAPWLGSMTEERWRKLTNARTVEKGSFGWPSTHDAGLDGLKTFEKIIAAQLDEEDLAAFMAAPIEPTEVINANLRERFMAKNRVYRYLQRLRVQSEARRKQLLEERDALTRVQTPDDVQKSRMKRIDEDLALLRRYEDAQLIEVEPTLNKNTATVARLLEVKARFNELSGAEDTREALRTALSRLTDEDFARGKADPVFLATLMATQPAGS